MRRGAFPPFDHRASVVIGCRATSWERDPRATRKTDPLLINGTTVDGVIHALSTATIPRQSSRGGERVDNPSNDLGRFAWRTGGCRLIEHRPIQSGAELRFPPLRPPRLGCLGTGAVDEAWKTHDRWRFCRGGRQPDRRGDRGREHRPIQSGAESRFPPPRPPRLGCHWVSRDIMGEGPPGDTKNRPPLDQWHHR